MMVVMMMIVITMTVMLMTQKTLTLTDAADDLLPAQITPSPSEELHYWLFPPEENDENVGKSSEKS